MFLRNTLLHASNTHHLHCFSKTKPTYAESFNYDHYFRWMQKTTRPKDAVLLHERFQEVAKNSIKYMGITLRTMTRILNKHDNQDIMLVNNFIGKRFDKLQLLHLSEFNSKEFSDFVLFFTSLTEANDGSIQQEIKTWVKMFLKYYIQSHFRCKEDKMSNTQILMSVMASIHKYYPELEQEYLDVVIAIFREYEQQLITENLTFFAFTDMLNTLSSNSNHKLTAFADSISNYIVKHSLIQSLQFNTLANLLSALLKIRPNATIRNLSNVIALIVSIEEYLCSSMSTMSAKDIEDSVPILMQITPESKFIRLFVNIIALSVNQQGGTCIQPFFLLQCLSWMNIDQIKTIKQLRPQWQQYFVSFLNKYFDPPANFIRPVSKNLQKIVDNKFLTDQLQQKVIKIIANRTKAKVNGDI